MNEKHAKLFSKEFSISYIKSKKKKSKLRKIDKSNRNFVFNRNKELLDLKLFSNKEYLKKINPSFQNMLE